MAIFNSYVKLPEGTFYIPKKSMKIQAALLSIRSKTSERLAKTAR